MPKLNVPLLKKIAKHITEKPRRFLMGTFVLKEVNVGQVYYNDLDKATRFEKCGTAACIAGWATILHDGPEANPKPGYASRGREILGLTDIQASSLFYYDEWPDPFRQSYVEAKTQSAKAKIAVKRIQHLIKTGE